MSKSGSLENIAKLDEAPNRVSNYISCSPSEILSNLPRTTSMGLGSAPSLSKFHSGFLRFQKTYFSENKALYSKLKQGQSPKTCLIGCCDSRVDPAIITDCDPGDIFVVRNVANLVPPYNENGGLHSTSSALEYAVKVLQVENIIILGHAKCGGIQALMENASSGLEFIGPWMKIAAGAREKALRFYKNEPLSIQCKACEQASIIQSLENLTTYPWINDRLKDQKLSIIGWYFNFDKGDLSAYSHKTSRFEAVTSEICTSLQID